MNILKLFSFRQYSSPVKLFTVAALICITLFATGCSRDFVLLKTNGTTLGPGTIYFRQHDAIDTVMLNIDGIIYSGPWVSHEVDESQSIAAGYDIPESGYKTYFHRGGNSNHLREVKLSLHSDKGNVLNCDLFYRGANGRGNCESDSKKIEVIISKSNLTVTAATVH